METKMNTLECAVELNDLRVDNLVKEKTEMANQIGALQAHIKDIKEKQETESNANKHLKAYILTEISKCLKNYDFLKQRTEVLYSKFPGLEPMWTNAIPTRTTRLTTYSKLSIPTKTSIK